MSDFWEGVLAVIAFIAASSVIIGVLVAQVSMYMDEYEGEHEDADDA